MVGQAGPGCSVHPPLLLMEPESRVYLGPLVLCRLRGLSLLRPCGPTYGVKLAWLPALFSLLTAFFLGPHAPFTGLT